MIVEIINRILEKHLKNYILVRPFLESDIDSAPLSRSPRKKPFSWNIPDLNKSPKLIKYKKISQTSTIEN